MTFHLTDNAYGKSGTRILTSFVDAFGVQKWIEADISVEIGGDFGAVFRLGDNAAILPTDSFVAHLEDIVSNFNDRNITLIGTKLLDRLMNAMEEARHGNVEITASRWISQGSVSNSLFKEAPSIIFSIYRGHDGTLAIYGKIALNLIRPSDSSFSGFRKDDFTNKHDLADRIIYGSLGARWKFNTVPLDTFEHNISVRDEIVNLFGAVPSRSLQEMLYAMAESLLQGRAEFDEVELNFKSIAAGAIDQEFKHQGQDRDIKVWRLLNSAVGTTRVKVARFSS